MLKLAIFSILNFSVLACAGHALAVGAQQGIAPKALPIKALEPSQSNLPTISNWLDIANTAQRLQLPIVIMVSLEGCGFCKTVRQGHLLPLFVLEPTAPRAIVRQIEINGTQTFADADGAIISHLKFAQKLGAKVAPTVYFLNAKAEQIAPPLEGVLLPDFYGAYLEDALAVATGKIRRAAEK